MHQGSIDHQKLYNTHIKDFLRRYQQEFKDNDIVPLIEAALDKLFPAKMVEQVVTQAKLEEFRAALGKVVDRNTGEVKAGFDEGTRTLERAETGCGSTGFYTPPHGKVKGAHNSFNVTSKTPCAKRRLTWKEQMPSPAEEPMGRHARLNNYSTDPSLGKLFSVDNARCGDSNRSPAGTFAASVLQAFSQNYQSKVKDPDLKIAYERLNKYHMTINTLIQKIDENLPEAAGFDAQQTVERFQDSCFFPRMFVDASADLSFDLPARFAGNLAVEVLKASRESALGSITRMRKEYRVMRPKLGTGDDTSYGAVEQYSLRDFEAREESTRTCCQAVTAFFCCSTGEAPPEEMHLLATTGSPKS